MRALLITAIAAVGMSGQALANGDGKCFDKATLSYVDCPSADIWTGFYAGLHAGYGSTDIDGGYDDNAVQLNFSYSEIEADGGVYGAQLGYNEQVDDSLVWGVEIDGSWVDAEDESGRTAAANPAFSRGEVNVNALGSLRVRAGLPIDNVLPYVTAGIGLVDYEQTLSRGTAAGAVSTLSEDETVFAGVFGGGLEIMAFGDVSIRAEGLYYVFDGDGLDPDPLLNPANQPRGVLEIDDFWVVRGGINFKL